MDIDNGTDDLEVATKRLKESPQPRTKLQPSQENWHNASTIGKRSIWLRYSLPSVHIALSMARLDLSQIGSQRETRKTMDTASESAIFSRRWKRYWSIWFHPETRVEQSWSWRTDFLTTR